MPGYIVSCIKNVCHVLIYKLYHSRIYLYFSVNWPTTLLNGHSQEHCKQIAHNPIEISYTEMRIPYSRGCFVLSKFTHDISFTLCYFTYPNLRNFNNVLNRKLQFRGSVRCFDCPFWPYYLVYTLSCFCIYCRSVSHNSGSF